MWDGRAAYLFGGWNGSAWSSTILRFDPATGVIRAMNATLPKARSDSAAVWAGGAAFLFGGWNGTTLFDDVLRYDPVADRLTTMRAHLPAASYAASVAWDGVSAWVVGGFEGCDADARGIAHCTFSSGVLRYDPRGDALTRTSVHLPSGRSDAGAAWDGWGLVLFGGEGPAGETAEVDRFVPATGTVERLATRLAGTLADPAAAWTGDAFALFGGTSRGAVFSNVTTFALPSDPPRVLFADPVSNLPSGVGGASAIAREGTVYLFGGFNGATLRYNADVLRYHADGEGVALDAAHLASPRWRTAAAWAGDVGVVVGGFDGNHTLADVATFDPVADRVTPSAARLPTGLAGASAASDGHDVFVLGGRNDSQVTDAILRYAPSSDTIVATGALLPSARWLASATWDGREVLLFGGYDGTKLLDDIVRYDPATGAVRVAHARLPEGLAGTSAAWDGRYAYVFGGEGLRGDNATSTFGAVYRYDPTSDVLVRANATLPSPRWETAAAWDGAAFEVLGGSNGGTTLDEIVRYRPNAPSFSPALGYAENGTTLTVDAGRSAATDTAVREATWDWGDGSARGAGMRASHTYALPGNYPVTLTLDDLEGTRASTTVSVNVAPATPVPPVAAFEGLARGLALDVDANASFDPDGHIVSYVWSFGDGTSDVGAATSHAFTRPGNYSVTLEVRDGEGLTNATTRTFVLARPPPKPVPSTPASTSPPTSTTAPADGITLPLVPTPPSPIPTPAHPPGFSFHIPDAGPLPILAMLGAIALAARGRSGPRRS